jgi:ubiquinone/menaquinone biosynthesis C-methylase UbiE
MTLTQNKKGSGSTQYDAIAQQYSRGEETRTIKKYVQTPSFLKIMGDITNKKILDLACGSGYLTRIMREKGAQVTGYDISEEMIKIAREIEKEEPLGIEYDVADARTLGVVGVFDILTAGYLLHYSPDKESLQKMCDSIFSNVKDGGRFVALNQSPRHPVSPFKKYGVIIEGKEPVQEGDELVLTFFDHDGTTLGSFSFFHWSTETYEQVLTQAGFRDVKWYPVSISEEGVAEYGQKFWDDYLACPTTIIIEAIK